jgi:zinc transporter ZupT
MDWILQGDWMIVQTNKIRIIILAILPILLLSSMVYYIMNATFIDRGNSLPDLAVEKIEFKEDEVNKIIVYLRNIGQESITISQADINDKPTHATVIPDTINRLESSKLIIYYPWIENVPYEIGITISDGTRFAFAVDAAVPTPEADNEQLLYFALIGSYVGIMPVILGFLWLPFMRRVDVRWYGFFLSLTSGLLAFLAIDAIIESLELTNRFTIVNGEILIPIITISTFLLLMLIKADKVKSALYLSYIIAVGIGLHNLGEGLAIGAATAIGAIALSRFLIIGFTIHNTTEGLAIVAPMTRSKVKITHLAILGLIAGAPTIVGAWIGSFVNMPIASIIFLSIGAGAIFQVIYAIFTWLKKEYDILSIRSIIGFVIGMLIMYITSILIA